MAGDRGSTAAAVFFLVVLCLHGFLATQNWTSGFMPGHEFRQTQTALIADYIDRQDNFSIDYETPILGKPWAFPLEFPFYQWCVVGLKRALDLPAVEAARALSLGSFYLALAAVHWGLFSLGVPAVRRWFMLAAVASAPVYLFYSRAFLIDPMAMMFSAWFLVAFIRFSQGGSWAWGVVATVAGTLGILIKSLVFFVWLFPAALYGAWRLVQAWRNGSGGMEVARTVARGVGPVVLPYLALRWWVERTDAIKAAHRSAWEFTSESLTRGNFGTFSLSSRFSWTTWRELGARWGEAITWPWAVALVLGLGFLVGRKERWGLAGLVGVWLFGQLAFPYAYAYQDYYFYAGAVFLLLAFGLTSALWVESGPGPWAVRIGMALLPFVLLGAAYSKTYYPMQQVRSAGGSGLTAALNDLLPADSVLMIVGEDWAAIKPYYSRRRALMVRRPLEHDADYIAGAIEDLADEDVGVLIMTGPVRHHDWIVRAVTEQLGLIGRPLFRHGESDVYVSSIYHKMMQQRLAPGVGNYPGIELVDPLADPDAHTVGRYPLSRGTARAAFPMVTPGLRFAQISFGYNRFEIEGREVVNFHAISELTLQPDKPRGELRWSYAVLDEAWQREGLRTNGADFVVLIEAADGSRREIFRDAVRPAEVEAERGFQEGVCTYALADGERLVLRSEDRGDSAFDWAVLAGVEVR